MVLAPKSIVRIRSLRKCHGAHTAVDGIDLDIGEGEIVGLLGPNGAGKSTTLECLLGLQRPDTGGIEIAGADILQLPEQVRAIVGAQIQPAALQDKITPREALAFFGLFHSNVENPDELLKRFGLAERAHSRVDTLSMGERQRLSVALAFLGRPQLLVLDEPTTGLDPLGRHDLHRILADFRDRGGSVLLSTHDLAEAEILCDRVAIIHHGRIVATGTPSELVSLARSGTTIRFRCAHPLGPLPANLAAGMRCADNGHGELHSHEPARAVAELAQHFAKTGNELIELTVRPPSLEDTFLSLTGERWEDAP